MTKKIEEIVMLGLDKFQKGLYWFSFSLINNAGVSTVNSLRSLYTDYGLRSFYTEFRFKTVSK